MQTTHFFDNIVKLFEEKFENKIPLTPEQEKVTCEIITLVSQKKPYNHDSMQILSVFEALKPYLPVGTTCDDLRRTTNLCYIASLVDLNVQDKPGSPNVSLKPGRPKISLDDYFKSLGKAWRDLYTIGGEGIGEGSARKLIFHEI